MEIKTRFAPSPTGCLHLGSARTALYSWLFARKNHGKFLLRIEDSDVCRSLKENVNIIIDEMKWLNLDWDEGPYFQGDRLGRYDAIIENMLANGIAYRCFCSKERLKKLRKQQIVSGEKPKYDGYCRDKYLYKSFGDSSCVVRFQNPKNGVVTFDDQIRGLITFKNEELDDLIIRRSDGNPTYNFCVVIDDMDMKITHVIRGEDHISNTPRQINILRALNAPIPKYAHLSMILRDDGTKLSKRNNEFGVRQYRERGFLPEAIVNFLLRLGYSHGNQEIFDVSEMIRFFDLKSLNVSSSILNLKKLIWLNHYYINHLPLDRVAYHLLWYMKYKNINYKIGPSLTDIVKFFGKRCKTFEDIVNSCCYLYFDFYEYHPDMAVQYLRKDVFEFFDILYSRLKDLNVWSYESVRETLFFTISELKTSIENVGSSLRFAITGGIRSPELVATLYVCGQVRLLKRISMALNYIVKNCS